ncbi:MAG: ABC transporter ATP-binding protein [Bdellovibrionaceae bacterium]|nr:ABC transporter ATP-binding protein [Pseudobdellovibrionaceae bacterium]
MALIEVNKVTRHFKMGDETVRALDGVQLSIDEGELVAIIGPSGCGKSTMMNILGILDVPDSGEYLLDGKDTKKMSDDERALYRNQKLGFVFQSFHLLPRMTALRNVELPLVYSATYDKTHSLSKMKEMAISAMQRVGLGDRLEHQPNELSGGQRQRVAIARALVNNPKLLLADEPTGNLDSKAGKEIIQLFQDLNRQGATVIMVTHDPEIAQRAGRVIAFKDGKVVEDRANS